VVSIGKPVEDLLKDPENAEWTSVSIELCGGTHLSNTREAGSFAVVAEEALAAGVRRITAVTGKEAQCAVDNSLSLHERVSSFYNLHLGLFLRLFLFCSPIITLIC
jgi:alanyl-tRNA synthetase